MAVYDPENQFMRTWLASCIVTELKKAGFEETDPSTLVEEVNLVKVPGGSGSPIGPPQFSKKKIVVKERVFIRKVEDRPGMMIKIFTSIVGGETRGAGNDSIRICGVYRTKHGASKGLLHTSRVHRVGKVEDIVERILERAREVYKKSKAPGLCERCGAPKFLSRKGNNVCAEICWKGGIHGEIMDDRKKRKQYRSGRYLNH